MQATAEHDLIVNYITPDTSVCYSKVQSGVKKVAPDGFHKRTGWYVSVFHENEHYNIPMRFVSQRDAELAMNNLVAEGLGTALDILKSPRRALEVMAEALPW